MDSTQQAVFLPNHRLSRQLLKTVPTQLFHLSHQYTKNMKDTIHQLFKTQQEPTQTQLSHHINSLHHLDTPSHQLFKTQQKPTHQTQLFHLNLQHMGNMETTFHQKTNTFQDHIKVIITKTLTGKIKLYLIKYP
jgi:predicted membrane protein